jgi:peptidoglycan lytic transglycosylase
MVVRMGASICVAAITVVYSSSSIARPANQSQNKPNVAAPGHVIVGVASEYNPYQPGYREGGAETASGERYDPAAWTAAILTGLREMFGGVRYGKDYRPAYALVAAAHKKVIVKINDVGPLEPGRVIDFNEQTMRYFDPTLQMGLIHIKVTPLPGDGWSAGPIAEKD